MIKGALNLELILLMLPIFPHFWWSFHIIHLTVWKICIGCVSDGISIPWWRSLAPGLPRTLMCSQGGEKSAFYLGPMTFLVCIPFPALQRFHSFSTNQAQNLNAIKPYENFEHIWIKSMNFYQIYLNTFTTTIPLTFPQVLMLILVSLVELVAIKIEINSSCTGMLILPVSLMSGIVAVQISLRFCQCELNYEIFVIDCTLEVLLLPLSCQNLSMPFFNMFS